MAGHLMTWARRQVFRQVALTATQRFILLLLADNGSWDDDDETWSARPFQKTLAEEADVDKRTVQRALKALEDKGVLVAAKRYRAGGAPAGNEYFFNVAIVENPIVAIGQLPNIPGGDMMSSLEISRGDTVPPLENSRDDTVSPTPLDPHELKGRHCAAPVDNSGRGDTGVASGVTPVSPPARDRKPAGRASLNPQENHQSSSSSPEPEPTGPAAVAAGDDDDQKIPGVDDSPRAASGPGVTIYRDVKLTQVAQQLNSITGLHLRDQELCFVIDRYLDRVESATSPIGLVLASAAREPETLRREVTKLFRGGLDTDATRSSDSGRVVEFSAPAKCPIPAHAEQGRMRSNCPNCHGKFGAWEFPEAITREIFQQLTPEAQANVETAGVQVREHVDPQTLRRIVAHPIKRRTG